MSRDIFSPSAALNGRSPMPKRSAGLILFRRPAPGAVELLLAHPGGPFWARKETGAWSIPKGEHGDDEDPAAAAAREFTEELGAAPPPGPWLSLGEAVQPCRKVVAAFAVEGDFDPTSLSGGTFELEWPPRSGLRRSYPEVDRVGWFDPEAAQAKLLRGQATFVARLLAALEDRRGALSRGR